MAHDEVLLKRIRKIVARKKNVSETKMFGGFALMVCGNMACGIKDDELMVRLGEAGAAAALKEPNVRVMDITGRVMKNYVTVSSEALKNDADLKRWLERGIAFARTLPKKG